MDTSTRLLVAISSLVLNLGARHLPGGLSPRLQAFTSSTGMRMLVVCAMFYLSTRDVMLSIALAFVFFAVVSTLLNERSRYSVIRLPVAPMIRLPITSSTAQVVPREHVTREAYDGAVDTVLRFRRQLRS